MGAGPLVGSLLLSEEQQHPMQEADEFRRPGVPALILLDSSLRPISYDAEAVRILTYPQDPQKIPTLTRHIESRLRPLLASLRGSSQLPAELVFQSGRRQYLARKFTLHSFQNASPSPSSRQPRHALLLERRKSKVVDLTAVVAQFRLTPREMETLGFLIQGMTTREIAKRMSISPETVKAFLRLVMIKMQVSTRSGILGKIVSISR